MRAPHVVLGIPVGSPERDIRRAYRRLAKQLHPDRAAPADRAAAHARFIELRAAYEAMLAQAAVVEVEGEEGAGPPKGEATFRPAGRQRGGPATGTGVAESDDRRSRPWMHWAVGLVAIAALTVGACVAVIGVEVAESEGGVTWGEQFASILLDVCDRNGMLRAAIEEGTGSGALGEAEGGQTNTEAPEAWPPPSALVPGGGHERPRSRGTDYHIPQEGESR
ncbi:MAG: J domain-containing protein [candidate division WS1 bacterium]|nr:J domain-containing protein [candidate division WS1 bacterium]